MPRYLTLGLLTLSLIAAVSAGPASALDGTTATGAGYSLSGVIAGSAAGTAAGGGYVLNGGLWALPGEASEPAPVQHRVFLPWASR